MSRAAVHMADPDAVRVTRDARALCNRASPRVTSVEADVTCKDCLRLLAKRRAEQPRQVGMLEALLEVARTISGPSLEAVPPTTPDTWSRMRCRLAVSRGEHSTTPVAEPWAHVISAQTVRLHCTCDHCNADRDNAKAKIEWQLEQDHRPHRQYEHPFGSTRAAIELLGRWRVDGGSGRSAHGSIQARAQETAQLGTSVQTTRRTDRDSLDVRRVIMTTDVQRACERAFAERQARRGLTVETCVTILVDSIASNRDAAWWAERLPPTERAIKALIRHGIKQVTVELAANGYIPRPRSSMGLDDAIERRRAEMGKSAA